MNADMPPMITACTVGDKTESDMLNPDNSEDLQGWLVHHPKHSTALYQHCQSVQSECAIATKIEVAGDFTDGSLDAATNIQDFMLGTLSPSP